MQEPVKKRARRGIPRWCWILTAAVLVAGIMAWILLEKAATGGNTVLYREMTDGNVIARETTEVSRITVSQQGKDPWSVTQTSEGVLTLDGVTDWDVDPDIASMLLEVAAVVRYEDILTEDPADYIQNKADFGLDDPLVIAGFEYTDGTACTVRIGMQSMIDEETYYYMTVDGDDRLFAVDVGTVQMLVDEESLLHPVIQPGINANRIDRIEVENGDGQIRAGWKLNGKITDSDSTEEWIVTSPITYPADQDSVSELLQNTANLYLGIYVDEAKAENLAQYGLDAPESVLVLHMAEGSTGEVNDEGQYIVTTQPEQTVRFEVGAAKNDLVRYVRYEDTVYTVNSFQLDVFLTADAMETVGRYPVSVAFEHLASLTVEKNGEAHDYSLNHLWTTDDEGNSVHDGECLKDGEEISYAAFEAAYERLRVVTVSGKLQDDDPKMGDAYMKYTFRTLNGGTHTVEFIQMDYYNDIAVCDGYALFYVARGSMTDLP